MNRSHRSVWNESLGAWVAASETTRARGKSGGARVLAAAAVLTAVALTSGGLAQAQTLLPSYALTSATDTATVPGLVANQGVYNTTAVTGVPKGAVFWSGVKWVGASGLHYFSVNSTDMAEFPSLERPT